MSTSFRSYIAVLCNSIDFFLRNFIKIKSKLHVSQRVGRNFMESSIWKIYFIGRHFSCSKFYRNGSTGPKQNQYSGLSTSKLLEILRPPALSSLLRRLVSNIVLFYSTIASTILQNFIKINPKLRPTMCRTKFD